MKPKVPAHQMHEYKPPRPEGEYYGPVYANPPGSMFLYRDVWKVLHVLLTLQEGWEGPRPVEAMNFLRTEIVEVKE
jgi:hypothetical protein